MSANQPIKVVYAEAIPAPTTSPSETVPQALNEGGAREYLLGQGFPDGLIETFITNLGRMPMRFFIVDDSGSMASNDGNMLHKSPTGAIKMIKCSRWAELTSALKFHVQFARDALAPTEFRLLNGSSPIRIGYNDADEAGRYSSLMALLDDSPNGATPLCRHIREVIAQIQSIEPQLRANGQKACVIIATDGESSDGNLAEAMRPLKNLPVWVVVRLCTDQDNVVNYWNNIDQELELNMDVLDDQAGEAAEVYSVNPWLTYGQPLQRLREFGVGVKEFDLLDESKLSKEQVRLLCKTIYGGTINDYPHPEADWPAFLLDIKRRNESIPKTWDTISKVPRHWVDTKALNSCYRKGNCTVC